MAGLDVAGFDTFFAAVHEGRQPFPWQHELVASVLETGDWPELVDVPTGLGKTSMLDVAVYVLAAAAHIEHYVAAARRRVFFVVDRRLVVDEAHEHAMLLAESLAAPAAEIVRDVALALRSLRGEAGDSDPPLTVTRMRGGVTWDSAWVDRPDQPAIVVGTVDQVGSRLFFRGYGSSDYRKPMDAALVGTDSLILVDEAHLAQALIETARSAFTLDGLPPHQPAQLPQAAIMQLTATAGDSSASRLEFDEASHLAHPVAAQRLTAPKRLQLASAESKKMPDMLAALMIELLSERPGARAMIVCNTVRTARMTHRAYLLEARRAGLAGSRTADGEAVLPELVIGRSRPSDRDRRVRQLLDRFGVGRPGPDDGSVDVVVATQTVEVGANLDVDILVTESAPLSALVQRLGRLNRLGASTIDTPTAVVVHDGRDDDPVYGAARATAWTFLVGAVGGVRNLAGVLPDEWPAIDVGPLAVRDLVRAAPPEAHAGPAPDVPFLFEPVLRSWARTAPIPENDAPVAPYLHGLATEVKSLQLFWRDDLLDDDDDGTSQRLDALPYVAAESVDVPYRAALTWLANGADMPVADVDVPQADAAPPDAVDENRRVWVRHGGQWRRVLPTPGQLHPGDLVAVPAQWGGLDSFGWAPLVTEPVIDVRDYARVSEQSIGRGRLSLRLDRRTRARVLIDPAGPIGDELDRAIRQLRNQLDPSRYNADEEPGDEDAEELLLGVLNRMRTNGVVRPTYVRLLESLTGPDGSRPVAVGQTDQLLLVRGRAENRDLGRVADATDDDAIGSSVSADRVTLRQHHDAVGERARTICAALGLDDELSELLVFAAEHHDLGKLDPRFQASLLDGNVFLAELLDEPLAKSGVDPSSQAARAARWRSGLPRGFRHEAWSACLAADAFGRTGWQADLVAHLVAAHHGRGRPLLPPVVDSAPQTLEYAHQDVVVKVVTDGARSVDWSAPARFDELNRRFGLWGLALLETIVRSADQTCSKEGT